MFFIGNTMDKSELFLQLMYVKPEMLKLHKQCMGPVVNVLRWESWRQGPVTELLRWTPEQEGVLDELFAPNSEVEI